MSTLPGAATSEESGRFCRALEVSSLIEAVSADLVRLERHRHEIDIEIAGQRAWLERLRAEMCVLIRAGDAECMQGPPPPWGDLRE